ncbi:MAG: allantoicase [Ignavibacteria bacterium]
MNEIKSAGFSGLVDLASEKLGGKAISASDEFFAPKENLLKSSKPVFIPDKYTDDGKWMDGWESRRKRVAGYDWCIIKLGVQGIIQGLDIDTDHFLGNHPPFASVDACLSNNKIVKEKEWKEILGKTPLEPGSQNLMPVSDDNIYNMVRLNIYPDGGVARFRVYGKVKPNWGLKKYNDLIDLAALVNGGRVLVCNDMFFGSKDNLISPGRSKFMGDGWETKRKRIPGYDWTIVKLASPGKIIKIIVDTNLFKGNYPDKCSIEGCYNTKISDHEITDPSVKWKELLKKTSLKGHKENLFENELTDIGSITHVRLNIFPDGGVSRLRLFGTPD